MTDIQEPADLLEDDDDDGYDEWADDWEYASSSQVIADLLIDKLAEKALPKVMWMRVIAEFHRAYEKKFSERVEVDEPGVTSVPTVRCDAFVCRMQRKAAKRVS